MKQYYLLCFAALLLFGKSFAQPTTNATTPPSRNALDVVSLFSDAYTNVSGTDWFPNWGQSTVVSDVTILGNTVKKYDNLNYQGVQFSGAINASSMAYLHIDIWTTNCTAFDVFLINTSPSTIEKSVTLTPSNTGWNSYDIPLSNFNTIALNNIGQLKLVGTPFGSSVVYLDNLYFWKSASTPTITDFILPAKLIGDAPFTITAPKSNSSGSFSYSSSNTNVATISGNLITITGGGTSIITATQAAAGNFGIGTATATLVVNFPMPSEAAPTPTKAANKVTSLFSDAYTNVPGIDWFPNWGQSTSVTDVPIGGNTTKKYDNLNYQGVQLAAVLDASKADYLHLDLWTPNCTSFELFLINTTPSTVEKSIVLTPKLSGWNSYDIALNEFAPVALNNITQLKIVGTNGSTVYLDNLYFYATSTGGSNGISLPINFEDANTAYTFTDFNGGAASVVNNPLVASENNSNKVGKLIKNADQTWGGSFITLAAPINFAGMNTISIKVLSPRIGAKILFKLENNSNGAVFIEKEKATTKANAWETLTFDYKDIDQKIEYQKIVLIMDNGTMGDGSNNFTFYFDDIQLGYTPVPGDNLAQISLPVSFDDALVNYTTTDFGNNQTEDATDPTNAGNKVKKTTKLQGAETWAGTTIGTSKGFANAIPITNTATKMSIRVFAPSAGIHVRLKIEDHTNTGKSVETEAITTQANSWETLVFDFKNEATGTAVLNTNYTYDMASVFFDFGNTGSNKVFYWDDVQMVSSLPVQLGNFTGIKNDQGCSLSWNTYSEVNHRGFSIQRSNDGKNWQSIGFVTPITGQNTVKNYQYTDHFPFVGLNYYRLMQHDYNGNSSISNTIVINAAQATNNTLSLFPNPATQKVRLALTNTYQAGTIITITNAASVVVRTISLQGNSSTSYQDIDISQLPKGIYAITLQNNQQKTTLPLLIQ